MWNAIAIVGDVSLQPGDSIANAVTLAGLDKYRRPIVYNGTDLPRETYAHLNVRRTVLSLTCLPLQIEENLIGAVECLTFEQAIGDDALEALQPVMSLASIALHSNNCRIAHSLGASL